MKSARRSLVLATVVLALSGAVSFAAEEPPTRFSATAVVNGPQGTRRMPVVLVVRRFTSMEEVRQLRGVLERGGQGALLGSLRGRQDGQIDLGGVVLPVALVAVEPNGDGFEYLFLTPRRISIDETTFGKESLDYPFGMAVLHVDGSGGGQGELHVAAALAIDPDGHVEVSDYDGADGHFEDLRAVEAPAASSW